MRHTAAPTPDRASRRRPARRPALRRAFTLFEVAISLAILAAVVVAVTLAFPQAIKAQQAARFRVYAGVLALQAMDAFANANHVWWDVQVESEKPGENHFMGQVPVDLDALLANGSIGFVPLPDELAHRLDSDDDEIARLLERGGHLCYPRAKAFEAGGDNRAQGLDAWSGPLPPETQSLLVGVVGDAQQNALPSHPCLAWPYHDHYPSPPQAWELESWMINGWPGRDEMLALFALMRADHVGGVIPGEPASTPDNWDPKDADQVDRQLAAAQLLVKAVFAAGDLEPMTVTTPLGATLAIELPKAPAQLPQPGAYLHATWDPTNRDIFPPPYQILALRYLAEAAVLRTGSEMGNHRSSTLLATDSQKQLAIRCHERCLEWTMRYAASDPYDWGAPRPLNRATAFDYPLLEYDLIPSPALPAIDVTAFPAASAASDPADDHSWRIVASRAPTNYGQACGISGWVDERIVDDGSGSEWLKQLFPTARCGSIPANHRMIAASWGDHTHANLVQPFAAAERSRQLVFWSADWRSYDDFESCAGGPYGSDQTLFDSKTGMQVSSVRSPLPPEFTSAFSADRTRIACARSDWPLYTTSRPTWLDTIDYKAAWLCLYGADRNGNGVLDRGPIPPSTRLRATTIVRFDYYDRRLILSVKQ